MFIKSLKISAQNRIIRNIEFHKGLNLIIDETPSGTSETGNNVGKTTVLRLIDYCLGGHVEGIYRSPEDHKSDDSVVKDFLTRNEILITLTLVDNLDKPQKTVVIERDFVRGKKGIYRIDKREISKTDPNDELEEAIMPEVQETSPSFRQIISHNIRIDDDRLTKTMNTIQMGKAEQYETLYLFMFGCPYKDGFLREKIFADITVNRNLMKRCERTRTKNDYKTALDLIDTEIEKLEIKKSTMNINPDLEKDLDELDKVKTRMNSISSNINSLSIRKDIINETIQNFENEKFDNNLSELHDIYQQASTLLPQLQKTFDELVVYHNTMLENKMRFVSAEIPNIERDISTKLHELKDLENNEALLAQKVMQSDSMQDLENLIKKMNELYQRKGDYQSKVEQIEEIETELKNLQNRLQKIDEGLYSKSFEMLLLEQIKKFNKIYSSISTLIYNEPYAIKYDIVKNKDKTYYKFTPIDVNFSSGKKQGEIFCFDIAYTIFADQENIPCLHFMLNDKKELVHSNQLVRFAEEVERINVQFVCSMLYDKLPEELKNEDYIILKLSQEDKLFKIEQLERN
jgi:uncharacterized protein YydD (DUF2326 family)